MKLRPGFTLLETLLTLALTSVVLGLLCMAVDVHLRVADAGRNEARAARSARLLLRQIAADLRNAIPVTQTSSIGCLQGNRGELQVDISRLPLFEEMPASPLGDVRTVSYFVAKPGDVKLPETSELQAEKCGLLRREWERAAFLWNVEQGRIDELNLALKVLSPDVERIEFAYMDGDKEHEDWDSVDLGKLPDAVKITLSIRQPRGKKQSLALDGTVEGIALASYSMLVDLPNARSTLDQAMAVASEQPAVAAAAPQDAKTPNPAGPETGSRSEGIKEIKPLDAGGGGQ